MKKINSAEAV